MRLPGFCLYILALIFKGERKEEDDGCTSIKKLISSCYGILFALVNNNSSFRSIDHDTSIPVRKINSPLNKNFPLSMSHNSEETGFLDPEKPQSVTTDWLTQQITLFWRQVENNHVEIITVFALTLILFGIIQMLKFLTRYKSKEEEIMLHTIENSFLELNNSMVKASENITTVTRAFVREKLKQSDKKCSELLTKLLESLQLQNMRSEEREAKSCYLIMKFRSARLLQYGQLNMYLESILEHLMKQQSELNAFHDSVFDIRSFADVISTQFSESRDNAQRFIKEILQSIQNNAFLEQDQVRSRDNLMNMVYILEPIVKKTSNSNFNLRNFNGFK